MRTLQQRIDAYNARMVSSQLDPVIAAKNAAQQVNFAAYAAEFVPLQLKLRVYLGGMAIPTAQYGAWEAFHGECFHLFKTTSGIGLITSLGIIVTKWGAPALLGNAAKPDMKAIILALYNVIVP